MEFTDLNHEPVGRFRSAANPVLEVLQPHELRLLRTA